MYVGNNRYSYIVSYCRIKGSMHILIVRCDVDHANSTLYSPSELQVAWSTPRDFECGHMVKIGLCDWMKDEIRIKVDEDHEQCTCFIEV